jgi:tetratricopeptide (TPR) repeat protein
MRAGFSSAVLTLAIFLAGCNSAGSRRADVSRESHARLYDGLGSHRREVTTTSDEARRYFDQGLIWAYAFNHDEAIRSFTKATELDPNFAMAWWGVALCHGPHINNPIMPEARRKAAWAALQQAKACKTRATPVEQRLIDALAARYSESLTADRRPLDEAYAAAMRGVYADYRNDPDVGALFAESMMDLRPWDLWTQDKQPQPGTQEIVATLEHAMSIAPSHPLACHLYIHAVEASPAPERADAAADRLRSSVPSAGHLVHMPAHIDIRRGRWAAASTANEHAIKADAKYRALSPTQEFYRVYMAHNHHFLSFAAMMSGRRAVALKAADEMIAGVPAEFVQNNAALVDPVAGIRIDVLKRFGNWDELLAEPAPPENLPYTRAMWHFSRGIAQAASGRIEEARREQAEFRAAAAKVPPDTMLMVNRAHDVLAIAEPMLEGEIAYREGRNDVAIAKLREAVAKEDSLRYMEPPEWIQPVRHALGAVLLVDGRAADAEVVFRDDLKRWPENGWALHGLERSLREQGQKTAAADVQARFEKAWAQADTPIASSCLCVALAE